MTAKGRRYDHATDNAKLDRTIQYIAGIKKIYGSHLRKMILFGSYARGDFKPDSELVNYPLYANINKEGVIL